MGFFAHTFTFDGIPSETYNLYIASPSGGDVTTNGANDVELVTDMPFRRSTPFLLGVKQTPVLEFPVSIYTPEELTAMETTLVQKWLFGQLQWKRLRIMQYDMQDIYFNVFLKEPKIQRIGNKIVGFDCTVHCDSPWGWQDINPYTVTYSTPPSSATFTINNITDNIDYTYPVVTAVVNGTGGGNLVLTNNTDVITTTQNSIVANETITINSNLQMIYSSSGLSIFDNFNGFWPRLLNGINAYTVSGQISSISFVYKLARKVGG